jgi:hypothetical protein
VLVALFDSNYRSDDGAEQRSRAKQCGGAQDIAAEEDVCLAGILPARTDDEVIKGIAVQIACGRDGYCGGIVGLRTDDPETLRWCQHSEVNIGEARTLAEYQVRLTSAARLLGKFGTNNYVVETVRVKVSRRGDDCSEVPLARSMDAETVSGRERGKVDVSEPAAFAKYDVALAGVRPGVADGIGELSSDDEIIKAVPVLIRPSLPIRTELWVAVAEPIAMPSDANATGSLTESALPACASVSVIVAVSIDPLSRSEMLISASTTATGAPLEINVAA